MPRRRLLLGLVGLVGSVGLLATVVVAGAACGHEHGPPRVQKLPVVDKVSALRGGGTARSPRIANYKIDARLDAAAHQITAAETLTWTNTGASQVEQLPFHLYMNAFKNESSLFMRSARADLRGAKPNDASWGWIQIDALQINGVELAGQLTYPELPDQTVAELQLPQPVQPGQTISINVKFTEQLPEVIARTGYKGEFIMVGQWFPKIGVRVGSPGAEHWECRPYTATAEFFADFGVYDVALTVPSTHVVAATGVLVNATDSAGNMRTLTYHAEDVHDFAWSADPYMTGLKTGKATLEDGIAVTVRVYYRPEQEAFAARHLQAAIGAIDKFSAYFTPYPWSIMTIVDPPVDAARDAGGMEYPTLVTTAGDSVFARPGMRLPEFTTVHEVGHNWFQGMLASNEPVEPWLDEGVDEWADAHVMADLYGGRTSAVDWMGFQAEEAGLRSALRPDPSELPSPIATAADAFPDRAAYENTAYIATLRALTTLEREVGTSKFMGAMKTYARTWAFQHPTGRDLFAVLEKELGTDLGWFLAPTFDGIGGVKLSVRSASCEPLHPPRGVLGDGPLRKTVTEPEAADSGAWDCDVTVQNLGAIHVPVDLLLEFADGSTQRLRWDDHNASWAHFAVQHSSRLVEVRIDPDNKIALDSPVEHRWRLEGNGAASLRAAARISSWTQTLMQLVGP